MNAKETLTCASSPALDWDSINWKKSEAAVLRLQMRIAKATREEKPGKVKALQWLLTHAWHAKLLAVKRVTSNKGKNTPGVDHKLWKTAASKLKAALSLKRRGYRAKPLRRIYIPKMTTGVRPLSIPTMGCRAMQALHLMALLPVAEEKGDKNAYGFRPKRGAADAITRSVGILNQKGSAPWILECDIKSCFDNLSKSWVLNNTPMDRYILKKWLDAGYMDQENFHHPKEGIYQGSIISPTLLNIALAGLEKKVQAFLPVKKGKVYMATYADDFIVTGATKELLEEKVRPAIDSFLKERGLELSQEKTRIVHISQGFDFLGTSFRKYNGKFLNQPSKKSIKACLSKIRQTIRSNRAASAENLIRLLNPQIRGWGYYMRHTCAKKAFATMDLHIFKALWRWVCRKHPHKSMGWRKARYFRRSGTKNWLFHAPIIKKDGQKEILDLTEIKRIAIKRHTKIRAAATPFNPAFKAYFEEREAGKRIRPDANPGKDRLEKLVFYRQSRGDGSSELGLTKA